MTRNGQRRVSGSGDTPELLDGLIRFTIGVLDARRVDEIADVVTEIAAPLVGAANAAFGVLEPGDVLRVHRGSRAGAKIAVVERSHLGDATPMTEAIRRNARITIRSGSAIRRRYPDFTSVGPGELQAIVAYPLRSDGEIVGACGLRFDRPNTITADVRAAVSRLVPIVEHALVRIIEREQLELHARRLEQSNRDLDAFASVAAHDLSAPVRRIGSYLQLLVEDVGELSPEAEGYVDRMRGQVMHLSALLRDTLAYAQVAGSSAVRQPVELASLVEEARTSMAGDLADAGAEIVVGELGRVDVEPTLIIQVFVDLFENSVKYRRESVAPHIEVHAEEVTSDEGRVWMRVDVADNGIGIDPERADEVFGMFSRLEVADARPGTGIGLAFVKRIIERHGGEIGVGDGIDGGAAIWFTLPAAHPLDRWS